MLSDLFDRFYLQRLAGHMSEPQGLSLHRLLSDRGLLTAHSHRRAPLSPSDATHGRSPSLASLLIPHIPSQPSSSLLHQPLYRQAAQAFFLFPYYEAAHPSLDLPPHHQQLPQSPASGSPAGSTAMNGDSSPKATVRPQHRPLFPMIHD